MNTKGVISRKRLLACAVFGLWLAALAALWPAADRMGAYESDGASMELVSGADSTRVHELVEGTEAAGVGKQAAAVVAARPGGLRGTDRSWLDHLRRRTAAAVSGRQGTSAITLAADGTIAAFTASATDTDRLVDTVRRQLASAPDGLQTYVTGEAALDVDADQLEAGTDTRLLLATVGVVVLLLILTYRSPVLWILPLVSVVAALVVAQAAIALYGALGGTYSDLTGKILTVLVFGIGTDYALLLVARFREELAAQDDPFAAMSRAVRRTARSVLCSAAAVVGGVWCLLLTSVPETRGLGPTLALSVVATSVVMLTLLPALLLISGRWMFWPSLPQAGRAGSMSKLWEKVSRAVTRRPVRAAFVSGALLLGLAQGVGAVQWGLSSVDQFRDQPESVAGLRVLTEHFPTGPVEPAVVAVRPSAARQARTALAGHSQVTAVDRTGRTDGWDLYEVQLRAAPFSRASENAVRSLRRTLSDAVGASALVGGTAAEAVDAQDAAEHDLMVTVPAILLVVGAVLVVFLRSWKIAGLLLATVTLTSLSAAGLTFALSRYVFGFGGIEPRIPLFAFVFVVAVGVDYSIFLLHRYREERRRHACSTSLHRAMASTGTVITSAGVVLAATFLVLAVLPLVPLTQMGMAVAIGILLDTFVVRPVLMPALLTLLDQGASGSERDVRADHGEPLSPAR
ncbi:MMPL family transporter [Streptomyces sp. Go-475]|uniref:MMPL family transporter n=1 Tax=Streptomyces sp. Go-475 TaxID=2072505 RepID=UPI000DEEDFFE|nr:MMPL family transporter [Streptomyces sp. Go-475]AXE83356.1 Membrane protein YdfJ [Streptomyces sp. Go-475]AXE90920.1 Membrane protein YdfJ [Streptomyces sp. Go-475]